MTFKVAIIIIKGMSENLTILEQFVMAVLKKKNIIGVFMKYFK